ncbi:MAG: hypothetical protein ACT4O2_13305, partial [Beijerinckiaceae bacterium]
DFIAFFIVLLPVSGLHTSVAGRQLHTWSAAPPGTGPWLKNYKPRTAFRRQPGLDPGTGMTREIIDNVIWY